MKFQEFINDLFNKGKKPPKPLFKGRPPNVLPNGRVLRHPGIVVAPAYRQHATKEGKLCFQAVKGGKRPPIPTMLHRAVPVEVFKARKNALARKAMGRYVW